MTSNDIIWPDKYRPGTSDIHVVNSLAMEASRHAVWNRLVRATEWPNWYPNSSDIRLLDTESDTLAMGTRFRWKTFGVTIQCTVEEFQPEERLAWSSNSRGMSVYHAWLITPQAQGCHVLTEETQHGLIPKIGKLFMPKRMHKFHQIWLEQLNRVAKSDAA